MRRFLLILLGMGMLGGSFFLFTRRMLTVSEREQQMQTEPTCAALDFPFRITDTELTALNFAYYDGPFMEDGSADEVSSVVALVLRNDGENMVESAHISMECDSGTISFRFTDLPSKATILIPELERSRQKPAQVYSCSAQTAQLAEPFSLAHALRIEEADSTTLKICNTSREMIGELGVYYKTYDFHSDMYIGGKTYRATIANLSPGQTVAISPYRYVKFYARVVALLPKR